MKQTNIAFLEIEDWEKEYIKDKLKGVNNLSLSFFPDPLSKVLNKIKNTNILAIFIYSKVNKSSLDKLPDLEYIATMSTGFDHIDLKTCGKRNIDVSNVPYYGENTVAEHTFALILALSRKIPLSIENMQKHNFDLKVLRGFDLKGKTLGIVGLGHIGLHVARIAKGFGMKIIAYDVKKDKKSIKYVGLNHLLSKSDIISLHAPYNKKTHHLINKKNIKLIKKGAYLINTARGGLIETQALIDALNQNIIAGAGLDVLEEECYIKEEKELLSKEFKCDLKTILQDHYLIHDPRVLVTPHSAFNSEEALQRILDTTIDNIKNYLNKKPSNLV